MAALRTLCFCMSKNDSVRGGIGYCERFVVEWCDIMFTLVSLYHSLNSYYLYEGKRSKKVFHFRQWEAFELLHLNGQILFNLLTKVTQESM